MKKKKKKKFPTIFCSFANINFSNTVKTNNGEKRSIYAPSPEVTDMEDLTTSLYRTAEQGRGIRHYIGEEFGKRFQQLPVDPV